MKEFFRFFYLPTSQISLLIKVSALFAKWGFWGKAISIILDNLLLALYSMEVTSRSLQINKLIVGHSTGVVLGGNGIACSGTLHVSSGVVFGRRYDTGLPSTSQNTPITNRNSFFTVEGNLTIGANSVLLGPLKIKGPVIIGAMSLVTHDILEPGIYVGIPAKKIKELK
jgi:serine acetyltransferase